MNTKNEISAAPVVGAASSASSPLPPVGGADALPAVEAPTPPANGNPVAANAQKGQRVIQAEVNLAESAVLELRSSTLFAQILGPRFGTANEIADAIEFAVQWHAQSKAATTWNRYTRKQSNLAWAYGLALLDRLRPAFQAVEATDPAIAKELPKFTQLLAVRQAVAAKAVATKRKIASGEIVVNKAAKPPRKRTKVSTKAAPAAHAPAPAPAEAAPTPAPAAPAKPEATPVAPSNANGVAHAGG